MSPSPSSIESTDRLFDLIERKLHLLDQMQLMTIEQSDLVSQHDMSGLMTLLSRKQSLMDGLQTIQQSLAGYRDEDPEARLWSSPEKRTSCQEMVGRCDQLIAELIVQENRSLESMNLKRDAVLIQLEHNVAASRLQEAYSSSAPNGPESSMGLSLEG
jgi:flagellar biosynthesis/type III secretory pathway chaperone